MKEFIKEKIEKIENDTAFRYGLEVKKTIRVFTITNFIRKVFKIW